MKLISKYILLVALLLTMNSCEDFFGDVNADPNRPLDVPVNVQLPATQVEIADLTGGGFSRFASVMSQQTEGVARQWASINNYSSFNSATLNTAWGNMYANILIELDVMTRSAETNGYNHYAGIGKILTAYSLMMGSDVWGDMPFTQGLQGTDVLQPVFDSQESIYGVITANLTDSKRLLGLDAGGLAPGADDLIYGGDASLWAKAASSLLARAYLHLSGRDASNYGNALNELGTAISSASENLTLNFTTAETNAHQWHRFNRDRTGDIEFHPTMAGIMMNLNDTVRMNMFSPTFVVGHPYMVPDYGQALISFRELKFLQAECLMQSGGSGADIHAAYMAGIQASFEHLGIDATGSAYTDYVGQSSVDPGVGNVTMDHIMIQKYIGLYVQPEVFNDIRRTGIPALNPTSGSAVPVRFPYGEDELLFNGDNVPNVSVFTDRVWWNQ